MAEDGLLRAAKSVTGNFLDGLVYLGELETKAVSTLVNDTGKVTTIVNGEVVKEERFGRVLEEKFDGQ